MASFTLDKLEAIRREAAKTQSEKDRETELHNHLNHDVPLSTAGYQQTLQTPAQKTASLLGAVQKKEYSNALARRANKKANEEYKKKVTQTGESEPISANPLSAHHSYRYSVNLYSVAPDITEHNIQAEIQKDNNKKIMVVASTAQHSFSIEDFSYKIGGYVGDPAYNNKSAIKMTIKEANGTKFLTSIVNAFAFRQAGGTSMYTNKYMIGVSFIGRDANNVVSPVKFGSTQKDAFWLTCHLTTIDTDVILSGATYDMTFTNFNDGVADVPANSTLRSALSYSNEELVTSADAKTLLETNFATKVKESINSLLNDMQNKSLVVGAHSEDDTDADRTAKQKKSEEIMNELAALEEEFSTEIAIRFDGAWDETEIAELAFYPLIVEKDSRNINSEVINIASGTSMKNAILDILSYTKLAVRKIAAIYPSSIDGVVYDTHFDVRTETEDTGKFSTITNRNIYKHTYVIFKKAEPRIGHQMVPFEVKRESLIKNTLGKAGINVFKHYQYTFTGNNNEILDFQLKIDNSWYRTLNNFAISQASKQNSTFYTDLANSPGRADSKTVTAGGSTEHDVGNDVAKIIATAQTRTEVPHASDKTKGENLGGGDGAVMAAGSETRTFTQQIVSSPHIATTLSIRGDPDYLSYEHPVSAAWVYLEMNNIKDDLDYSNKNAEEPDKIMSNMYRVTGTEHNFEGGKYTVTINAIKNPGWYIV